MLKRTVGLFAFGLAAVLLMSSSTPAQGPGGDAKKLEAQLERLRDQVRETEAQLAKAKEAGRKGGFEGKGKGKGFDKADLKKKFEGKKDFGKGGFPPFGGKGGPKLDPDTIRQKYAYYKKLYDELPKQSAKPTTPRPGFGKRPDGGSSSIEARLDRLARDLEELRKELKKR